MKVRIATWMWIRIFWRIIMTIVRIEYLIDFQTLFTYLHAGLTHSRKVLVTFVCTIAVWLHLRCGLSRANADRLMKAIHILISLAINFGRLLVNFQYPDVALRPLPTPPIPHDVRTAIATLSLDPKIIRSICCPKCYSKYSLNHLPEICGRRETARSQPSEWWLVVAVNVCSSIWITKLTRDFPPGPSWPVFCGPGLATEVNESACDQMVMIGLTWRKGGTYLWLSSSSFLAMCWTCWLSGGEEGVRFTISALTSHEVLKSRVIGTPRNLSV